MDNTTAQRDAKAGPPEAKGNRRTWIIVGVLVAVLFGLVAAFVATMLFTISSVLKESDAYRNAVQTMQANARVVEILGAPVTTGLPSGNVRISGPSGEAQLAIPVEGRKAKGTLYIEATRSMGVWKTDRLVLELADGQRIDLAGGTPI